jgi:hypothetical protein
MNYAKQLDLDAVEAMLTDEQMVKLKGWLRQPGLGVAVYAGDNGTKHLITYGVRTARIPNRFPPSFYGTWPIHGFIAPGTAVPGKMNEGLARLGPAGDGTWA